MNRLLTPQNFDPLFQSLQGKRVGYLKMLGNVGDRLIDWATEQLFAEFNVSYGSLNWFDGGTNCDLVLKHIDVIAVAGGGNLGTRYQNCYQLRKRYWDYDIPIIVLPQSITNLDEDLGAYETIFLREKSSQQLFPKGVLAPDLALGFNPPEIEVIRDIEIGIFIREDDENITGYPKASLGDPTLICDSVLEYLKLAARCEIIYTDRLHFAIAGLIAGTEVHLLPGDYHKNKSMFETWMSDLGCYWCEDPSLLPNIPANFVDEMFTTLSLPEARAIPWKSKPRLVTKTDVLYEKEQITLRNAETNSEIVFNNDVANILEEMDGKKTLSDISVELSQTQKITKLDASRDVQFVISAIRNAGMIEFRETDLAQEKSISNLTDYCDLHVEPPFHIGNVIRFQATFRIADGKPTVIWFETTQSEGMTFSATADAFVLVCLLPAMKQGALLRVTGFPVSHGLLEYIYEFQMLFNSWYPDLQRISIFAEVSTLIPKSDKSIAAFSGGVDSTFSILRQLKDTNTYNNHNLGKAVFVRGLDIYLSSTMEFNEAFSRIKSILEKQAIEVISLNTNIRELFSNWKRSHGVCLAACLSVFNHEYSKGILASTIPYKMLYPFGSNAITDRFLGSENFNIIHDGAELTRLEKVFYLTNFPEILPHLRFCFKPRVANNNCGRCKKCITTTILFKAAGKNLSCFVDPPTDNILKNRLAHIEQSLIMNDLDYLDLKEAYQIIKDWTEKPIWVESLERLIESVPNKFLVRDNLG